MVKQRKNLIIITTLLCLSPILASAVLWNQMPDSIVTHWDFNNQPNGWMPKPLALIGLPAFMAIMNLICAFAVKIDPKSQNINNKTFGIILLIMPCMSILLSAVTIGAAMGQEINVGGIVVALLGFIFIALGNTLPKNSVNYTVGARTPWTLENPEVWQKTNRVSGLCMVICGVLCLVAGFLNLVGLVGAWALVAAIVITIVIAIATAVYSYILYKKAQA